MLRRLTHALHLQSHPRGAGHSPRAHREPARGQRQARHAPLRDRARIGRGKASEESTDGGRKHLLTVSAICLSQNQKKESMYEGA
jgi:hypothetical protein